MSLSSAALDNELSNIQFDKPPAPSRFIALSSLLPRDQVDEIARLEKLAVEKEKSGPLNFAEVNQCLYQALIAQAEIYLSEHAPQAYDERLASVPKPAENSLAELLALVKNQSSKPIALIIFNREAIELFTPLHWALLHVTSFLRAPQGAPLLSAEDRWLIQSKINEFCHASTIASKENIEFARLLLLGQADFPFYDSPALVSQVLKAGDVREALNLLSGHSEHSKWHHNESTEVFKGRFRIENSTLSDGEGKPLLLFSEGEGSRDVFEYLQSFPISQEQKSEVLVNLILLEIPGLGDFISTALKLLGGIDVMTLSSKSMTNARARAKVVIAFMQSWDAAGHEQKYQAALEKYNGKRRDKGELEFNEKEQEGLRTEETGKYAESIVEILVSALSVPFALDVLREELGKLDVLPQESFISKMSTAFSLSIPRATMRFSELLIGKTSANKDMVLCGDASLKWLFDNIQLFRDAEFLKGKAPAVVGGAQINSGEHVDYSPQSLQMLERLLVVNDTTIKIFVERLPRVIFLNVLERLVCGIFVGVNAAARKSTVARGLLTVFEALDLLVGEQATDPTYLDAAMLLVFDGMDQTLDSSPAFVAALASLIGQAGYEPYIQKMLKSFSKLHSQQSLFFNQQILLQAITQKVDYFHKAVKVLQAKSSTDHGALKVFYAEDGSYKDLCSAQFVISYRMKYYEEKAGQNEDKKEVHKRDFLKNLLPLLPDLYCPDYEMAEPVLIALMMKCYVLHKSYGQQNYAELVSPKVDSMTLDQLKACLKGTRGDKAKLDDPLGYLIREEIVGGGEKCKESLLALPDLVLERILSGSNFDRETLSALSSGVMAKMKGLIPGDNRRRSSAGGVSGQPSTPSLLVHAALISGGNLSVDGGSSDHSNDSQSDTSSVAGSDGGAKKAGGLKGLLGKWG